MVSRALALAALIASVAGCSDAEGTADYGDAGADAGVAGPAHDAGASADGSADAAPPPADDGGGISEGEYGRGDVDPAFGSCFNGLDDDADGSGDCRDVSCRTNVPACCVGSGDATCCVMGTAQALPIDECNVGVVDGCAALVALAEPFGSPRPEIGVHGDDTEPLTLVPHGQTTDSGLFLNDVIDPRVRAVTVQARIAGSIGGHAAGADVVAIGLIDAASTTSLTHVAPIVAFMISGNRGEVSLLVAGEIVARSPLTAGFHDYALAVRPNGAVTLTRDGAPLGAGTLSIDRRVRPIVYGRTFNRSSITPDPVRIESLSVRGDACDVPTALSDGEVIFPPPGDASWDAVRRVASPSVERWVDGLGVSHELMALEIDGAIYLASSDGSSWTLESAIGEPALAGGASWAARVGDPVLRWTGTTLELWFTGYEGTTGTVARVRAAEGTETFAWAGVEPLLIPEAGESFAQPAPFPGSPSYVVVRAREGDRDVLVLYREDAGSWTRVSMLRAPSEQLSAFDRDEVASPRVIGGSVHRLYFAGRRGVRWSVGMLVSPDGLTWIEPQGGALVRGSSGAGFDAIGASDPEPVIDGDSVRLFYTGFDGERARIGVATGSAPPR